jgi:hypothetical protein
MRTGFAVAATLLAATVSLFGNVVAPVLVTLSQSADLIVVASASGDFQAGSAVRFTLQVARVLKGDAALMNSAIPIHWTSTGIVPGMARAGDKFTASGNGLWFLKTSPGGGWTLMPVIQGQVTLDLTFFPVPDGPVLSAYTYSPTASLSDKVASELASAIESFHGNLNLQLNLLHYDLLDQLQSPVLKVLYERASMSSSPPEQALGLAGLIRGGSTAALRSAVQAAPQTKELDPARQHSQRVPRLRCGLGSHPWASRERTRPQSGFPGGRGPCAGVDSHCCGVARSGRSSRRPGRGTAGRGDRRPGGIREWPADPDHPGHPESELSAARRQCAVSNLRCGPVFRNGETSHRAERDGVSGFLEKPVVRTVGQPGVLIAGCSDRIRACGSTVCVGPVPSPGLLFLPDMMKAIL